MKLRITSHGIPSPGHRESEDVFAVAPLEDGGALCVLADGVGAARDPRRCAERVVRLFSGNFAAHPRDWSIRKTLERLLEQANKSLYAEGAYRDGTASMQTTLAAACISGARVCGINVGDSPILLLRDGVIRRLSRAHTRKDSEGGETLTGAVGMGDAVPSHYFEESIQEGDMLVITSDGLTHLLDDDLLAKIVCRFRSARSLLDEAVSRRPAPHFDDLSAIVAEVEEVGPELDDGPTFPIPRLAKNEIVDGHRLLSRMSGSDRVWLAEKDGQRFVVKFVPQEAETDDSGVIRARFAHEAWNACRFDSDFTVRARRPESGSPHYYIMDYIEAPSLRFVLRSRRFGAEEAVALGRFLCHAGQWLLRHEMVHGDIKPDNLLALRRGDDIEFKLLDLGLALPVFTEAGASGTPSYLAPERFAGAALTERTEIFSIGATLYEMLAARPPHGRIERFQKPAFKPVQRPSRANPNVPPWLDAVILKCLSTRQQARFQTYSELLFALGHPESAATDFVEPLLTRNPLRFYQIAFWILLLTTLLLLLKLFASP
ncbi:MAG: protein phosphatase 2C domain-containing protein [Terrimicrobiaceae bacterium]|nr:protein phosphatase 2C domain-containing protein [Terrimicrobiaceae bacterium]